MSESAQEEEKLRQLLGRYIEVDELVAYLQEKVQEDRELHQVKRELMTKEEYYAKKLTISRITYILKVLKP